MTELAERAERELTDILARYTAGEADVVRPFFARPHEPEEHADVLCRQMGRELFCVAWLDRANRWAAEMERSVDRHRLVDLLEQIAEEVKHYVLLADVAEWVLGRKLSAEQAREYEVYAAPDPNRPRERHHNPRLPEANAMIDMLWRFRVEERAEFSDEVMRLSEGGGGAAFLEAGRLSGDEFRERFAAAMRAIADDEVDHGPRPGPGVAAKYVNSESDLAQATDQLREVMTQHLRVRNEIYRYPLSAERLAAIDAGQIEPWAMAASTAAASA